MEHKGRLRNVMEVYNDIQHRVVGFSSNESMKSENLERVRENQKMHAKEFIERKLEKLKVNDIGFIRNENRIDKMDLE